MKIIFLKGQYVYSDCSVMKTMGVCLLSLFWHQRSANEDLSLLIKTSSQKLQSAPLISKRPKNTSLNEKCSDSEIPVDCAHGDEPSWLNSLRREMYHVAC